MTASMRRSGAFSPPLSSSTSHSHVAQTKLNIVSRLAIEGKAKRGSDGATIRIFLKISIPIESASPGLTVPLFPEGNVKVQDSQVHPIDANSVPYNFSSSHSPLLHRTARALNLPSRSTKSYMTLFGTPANHATPTSSRIQSPNGTTGSPLEERYTGYVLVSGYNVCYVLPKEFPTKYQIGVATPDSDDDMRTTASGMKTPYKGRRGSFSDKVVLQFMAGLDLVIPYLSKPPKAPYLLSIPIPRCLSNTISVRIFPPTSAAASFASLSSEEDSGGWDLTTDPHVTRTASRHPSRSGMYNHFGDDESSDSSVTGFSDGCGIQGTFPSSDCVRIRWATPSKNQESPDHSDGRRRVGVTNVLGDMTCTLLGRDGDGVKMRINYQGTCKGIYFPGVATMLGMDVALDINDCKTVWPADDDCQWEVDGSTGFTGFDVGTPIRNPSRLPSMDFPSLTVQQLPPSPNRPFGEDRRTSRSSSTSTTLSTASASLLRAPLPLPHLAQEYSFEGNSSPTASTAPSTISSLTPSSSVNTLGLGLPSELVSPSVPITVHLNMNDLLPPSKNAMTFNITGTVTIFPPAFSDSPDKSSFDPNTITVPLPSFRVLTAEDEAVSMTVRSHAENAIVEVHNKPGSSRAMAKTTELPNGSQIRCGVDFTSISLKPLALPPKVELERPHASSMRIRTSTPDTIQRGPMSTSPDAVKDALPAQPYREGPLIIPWVVATVVPLPEELVSTVPSYAVTLSLPAPADHPSEWLEFGLAMPPGEPSTSVAKGIDWNKYPPQVDIVNASISGVPMRFESFGRLQPESGGLPAPEPKDGKKKWLTWVRVRCRGVGDLEVLYTVRENPESPPPVGKGKGKATSNSEVNLFLPLFPLPVGRMEIVVDKLADREVAARSSQLSYQNLLHAYKFLDFNMDPFVYWPVVLSVRPNSRDTQLSYPSRLVVHMVKAIASILPFVIAIGALIYLVKLGRDIEQMKGAMGHPDGWDDVSRPSVTATVQGHAPSPDRWWFADSPTTASTSSRTPGNTEPYLYDREPFSPTKPAATEHITETTSLLPYMSFTWLEELPAELERAKATLWGAVEQAWTVLQMVLHWPLSPED